MTSHTDVEISLCREIAAIWRKPIGAGDWVVELDGLAHLVTLDSAENDSDIPLLALSDCLDKLREMGWLLDSAVETTDLFSVRFWKPSEKPLIAIDATLREAALRALLEALRREK